MPAVLAPRVATAAGWLLTAVVVPVGALTVGPLARRGVDCSRPSEVCAGPVEAGLAVLLTTLAVLAVGAVLLCWVLAAPIVGPETHAVVAWTTLQLVSAGAVVGVGIVAVRQLGDGAPNLPRMLAGLVLVMVAAVIPVLVGWRRPLRYAVVCTVLAAGALLWAEQLVPAAAALVCYAGALAASAVSALHAGTRDG